MAKLSSFHSSRFRRYPDDGYIGGVCAGVADFLGWNVRLIRALAVLTFIFGGFFPIVLVYGLLWYVMEETRGKPSLLPPSTTVRIAAAIAATVAVMAAVVPTLTAPITTLAPRAGRCPVPT